MAAEPPAAVNLSATDRGREIEATFWGVVGRLRARGWRISMWEIQRAQDVIAYLYVRLQRPPSDEELMRHLRPVLCAKDSELAAFTDLFRETVATAPLPHAAPTEKRRRGPVWLLLLGVVAVAAFALAFFQLQPPSPTPSPEPGPSNSAGFWQIPLWMLLAVVSATIVVLLLVWSVLHKQLRRRSERRAPGQEIELRWTTGHPLPERECFRTARALRARSREPGDDLDLRRTVDASIRAGMRLTPRYVQHKRSPEYLAVIERRSVNDVLAAHHARILDQLGAQGVALRRVSLNPRSRTVVDPVHGRRLLETLQPSSERERVLLFARDRSLRDPISGDARPWLTRFDRWQETTHIGPDADPGRRLPVVDRVLPDVRAFDPEWARAGHTVAVHAVPAIFENGDELWIEGCPPSTHELTRALDLLGTALGERGWYWLSACALYPEINYDLTVALGRLLRGDDGEPVAAHVDIAQLAQLPWFRHAYMPDWLRATLIGTLSHGQLVDARAALDQILVSGLADSTGARGGLSVVGSGPAVGAAVRDAVAGAAKPRDRVYLDGVTLRRQRLAAAAPRELVTAIRRRRRQRPNANRTADAPSRRVRRALAWCNGLLLLAALLAPVTIMAPLLVIIGSGWSSEASDTGGSSSSGWEVAAGIGSTFVLVPAVIALVFSPLAGRRRGIVTGGVALAYLPALIIALDVAESGNAVTPRLALLGVFVAVLVVTVIALRMSDHQPPVPWSRFQRRNRIAFAVGVGGVVSDTITWAVLRSQSPPSTGVGVVLVMGLLAAFIVLLAAAYFAGVRFVPLLAGGVVLVGSAISVLEPAGLTSVVLFGLPALAVLGYFYWQMMRVRAHPPPEFWETAGRRWKWPSAIAGLLITAVVALGFLGTVAGVLIAIPTAAVLLNLGASLLSHRLIRLGARLGISGRFPLRFD